MSVFEIGNFGENAANPHSTVEHLNATQRQSFLGFIWIPILSISPITHAKFLSLFNGGGGGTHPQID